MNDVKFILWPGILFFIGLFTRFIGMLFKIRHWPWADELMMLGYVICGVAVLFIAIKLIFRRKSRN
jgi:hypothetical protein